MINDNQIRILKIARDRDLGSGVCAHDFKATWGQLDRLCKRQYLFKKRNAQIHRSQGQNFYSLTSVGRLVVDGGLNE